MGFYDEKAEITYLSNGIKEVAFINMHHIGKKEFYDDVSSKIDSLKKQQYIVFYESYAEEAETDSLTKDINERKLRKLLGISTAEYFDAENNLFLGKYKINKKHKLMNQPAAYEMNIDTTKAIRVDISPSTMINEFETKYQKIELDDCDLKTNLNSKIYDCAKIEKSEIKYFMDEIVIELRDKNLANKVQSHKSNKIVVVYGSIHLRGMRVELEKIDSSWDYSREKNNENN